MAQHGPIDRIRRLRILGVGAAHNFALQAHIRDRLWVYGHHLDHLVMLQVAALGSSCKNTRVIVPHDILIAVDIADVVDLGVRGSARLGRNGAVVAGSLGAITKQPILESLEAWLLIEGIGRVETSRRHLAQVYGIDLLVLRIDDAA